METTPGFVETQPPPPPPPRPSRKGLWTGLAIGAVVLCLCGIIVIGAYTFRQDIPYLSNFFPSPTPAGLLYENPAAGISLIYPDTWQYTEAGDAASGYEIIFASSTDLLFSSAVPQTGAALIIWTDVLKISDLPFTVDASTLGDVIHYLAITFFTNVDQGQNLRTFTVDGYPAASGVFSVIDETGAATAAYFIGVLRNDEILIFTGICPQIEWAQHQITFDAILNSVRLVVP